MSVFRAVLITLAAAATRAVSGFEVEIIQASSSSTAVKENDLVLAVLRVEMDPPHPVPEEGVVMDTEDYYWTYAVHGGPQSSEELQLPEGESLQIPYGWWKGTVGAKLGEKRLVTVPESESFQGDDADMLEDGHRGLKVMMEIVKINDEAIEGFEERFVDQHEFSEY